MSASNKLAIAYKEELTFGVEPGGDYKKLRFISENLNQKADYVESDEIREDRANVDTIRVDAHCNGDLGFELSYGTYDPFIEALMGGTWSAAVEIVASTENLQIDFNSSAGTVEATGKFLNSAIAIGDWLVFSGLTGGLVSMNGTPFRVIDRIDDDQVVVAGKIALIDGTQAASASDNGVITKASNLVNGSTTRSFSLEKNYTDLSATYIRLLGQKISGFTLEVPTAGKVTGNLSLMGKVEEMSGTGHSVTPATTTRIFDTTSNIEAIIEGTPVAGTTNSFKGTFFSINISDDLRAQPELGELGPQGIGEGKLSITGKIRAYFKSAPLRTKFLNDTDSSLILMMKDREGNRYIFDLPQVKYTAGANENSGPSTDIVEDLDWTASLDPTEGIVARLVRITT